MLELQVGEAEVFAFYRPPNAGPNVGAYLRTVFPGGHFKGIGFEALRSLGTGLHDVPVDERAPSEQGQEPAGWTEWDRRMAAFHYALFAYGVGAVTATGVLNRARAVFDHEAEQGMRLRHFPP